MQQPDAYLLPEDVVHVTFTTTRLRSGYDQDQVDQWLDDVVATMRLHIDGQPAADPLRSADVPAAAFRTVRWRDGYDMVEVDDFLDRVQATLDALERGLRPS